MNGNNLVKNGNIIFDKSKMNEVETVIALKQFRCKPEREKISRRIMPGEKFEVSGITKAEVILNGLATLDLNAVIPKSTKRVAPKPGEEKYLNPEGFYQIRQLEKKVNELTAMIEVLVKKK